MKKVFKKLVTITNQMAAAKGCRVSVCYSSPHCWADLAAFWSNHPDVFKDPFYYSLYHIAVGTYPNRVPCNSQHRVFYALVEEAIIAGDQAVEQWVCLSFYKDALYRTCVRKSRRASGRWKSEVLHRVSHVRFLMLVLQRETIKNSAKKPYLTDMEQEDLIFALENQELLADFSRIVRKLAPKFSSCSSKVWGSERAFFSELKKACGVDFSKHPEAFDIAYDLIDEKRCGAYYRVLFKYEDIPEDVVTLIWPNPDEMKKELCTQFRWLCSASPWVEPILGCDTSAETVRKSWAYRQLLRWREDGSIKFTRKMTGNLMLIGEGTHPYTSRQNQKAKESTVA